MKLVFVPLLRVQRDLYRLPRGPGRFKAYLDTMTGPEHNSLDVPLTGMNPMAKDHVPARLEEYLALEADTVAAQALAEAAEDVADVAGDYRLALVLVDDVLGGWTNRWTTEFTHRFADAALTKRGWLVGMLFVSEPAELRKVGEAVRTSVHRAAYIARHGRPGNLREMLAQEGAAMARADCRGPLLEAEDLAYTRAIIAPLADAVDQPTIMACLFGDTGARELGYREQGLSERAGLALALHDARRG